MMIIPTVDYRRGALEIIDQTLLPGEERVVRLTGVREAAEAIASLRVRGAPALGIAAAYGMLLSLERYLRERVRPAPDYFFDRLSPGGSWSEERLETREMGAVLEAARLAIAATRPTAVNLFAALERMRAVYGETGSGPRELCARVAAAAFAIHAEELEVELAIGRNGAPLIRAGTNVLTHCNAGGLATAGYGTALGILYTAWERGARFHVFADETRPLLQGARLTAWELGKHGIPHTILCEGAAASLFAAGKIDAVIVGADRIAACGDVANKVGTMSLAILCEKFGKPFYVAAPWSTFDLGISSGAEIPIEQRSGEEVTSFRGVMVAPPGSTAYNPAFDVTPADLIAAIVTERGVIERPDARKVRCVRDSSG